VTKTFESATPKPIGWSLVTGSGTSGGDRNPAFTVIDWDAEFMVPVNTHTYYMNLTEANANPNNEPVWKELHDFKVEYSLPDLSPDSMKDFAYRMNDDSKLA